MKQFASIVNGRMVDIVPEFAASGEGVDAVAVPLADRYTPEFIASLVPYESESSTHEPPPAAAPLPTAVTMRQARLALLAADKLSTVNAALDALPDDRREAARIEWEFATTVERASPLVAMLASALGLDDASLDQLFVDAAAF